MPDRLLKIDAAAKVLAISKAKLYQMIQRREIAVVEMGRSLRIDPREIEAFVARNTRPAKGE